MNTKKKIILSRGRHLRVRKKVVGTLERPRLSVKFTNCHIYAQLVDDIVGKTLLSVTTNSNSGEGSICGANARNSEIIGTKLANLALSAGFKTLVFDRGSAKYHGKVKALADAVRSVGLKF